MKKEIPAKGKQGYILDLGGGKKVFRIYDSPGEKTYTDYELDCEEIKVEIIGDWTSLYRGKVNSIDWSQKVLKAGVLKNRGDEK